MATGWRARRSQPPTPATTRCGGGQLGAGGTGACANCLLGAGRVWPQPPNRFTRAFPQAMYLQQESGSEEEEDEEEEGPGGDVQLAAALGLLPGARGALAGRQWGYGPISDPRRVAAALVEALRRAGGGTVVMMDREVGRVGAGLPVGLCVWRGHAVTLWQRRGRRALCLPVVPAQQAWAQAARPEKCLGRSAWRAPVAQPIKQTRPGLLRTAAASVPAVLERLAAAAGGLWSGGSGTMLAHCCACCPRPPGRPLQGQVWTQHLPPCAVAGAGAPAGPPRCVPPHRPAVARRRTAAVGGCSHHTTNHPALQRQTRS